MTVTIGDALFSLKRGKEWTVDGNTYAGINWLDETDTKPTEAEVNAEIDRLNMLETYQIPRLKQYPSIQNQLDLLYWDKKNGTNKWVETIDKVKSDNPKP